VLSGGAGWLAGKVTKGMGTHKPLKQGGPTRWQVPVWVPLHKEQQRVCKTLTLRLPTDRCRGRRWNKAAAHMVQRCMHISAAGPP